MIETWFNQDVKNAVKVQYLDGNVFSQDNNGNKIGVSLYEGETPVNVSGSVSASVIRSDGATVAVTGSSSGNQAWVVLPQSCYAVPGVISIVIKATSGSDITTLCAVVANVYQSSTDSTVDPGTIIPSISDLISEIETAVASIPADYSSLWTSLAPAFSSSLAYKAGQYVTYDGSVYRFMVDHAAGSWDANHAAPVDIGRGISDNYKAFSAIAGNVPIVMIPGKYIALNGSAVTMTDGVPTLTGNSSAGYAVGMMPCSENDIFTINGKGGSSTRLWAFANSSGTILSVAAANKTENGLVLTAPANAAYIIIHTNDGRTSFKGYNQSLQFENNTVDILSYLPRTSQTVASVSFAWTGNVCVVDGEATGGSAWNFFTTYNDKTPSFIVQNGKYFVHFKQGSGGNVALGFAWKLSDDSVKREYYYTDSTVVAPSNFVGVSIALVVKTGLDADNETVEVNLFTDTGSVAIVNERVTNIEEAIVDLLPKNILPDFGTFETDTKFGVTYTWQSDKKTCIVDGTAESGHTSYNFIWWYYDGLPAEIRPGEQYRLVYNSSVESVVGVHFYYLKENSQGEESISDARYFNNTVITVPDDCIGISIRLDVDGGTVCDDVEVSVELMTVGISDNQGGVANHTSKLLSVGSSFMTGVIYPDGETMIYCDYDSTPYGNVAIALGIEEKNVQHILMSSTGLLYAAKQARGNILDKIKSMDLSPYDYVLTQYNRPDLGTGSNQGFPLGDLTSTAGDGSIVGAVLDLLAYMKTSNPSATLILVGAPPSSTQDSSAYDKVFTAKYNNGVSIGEADLMMHRLAVREHFIFMDWEDLNLSYYYKDFCYPGNVHCMTEAPVRMMGQYLARQCNYANSLAKVLKADAEEQ